MKRTPHCPGYRRRRNPLGRALMPRYTVSNDYRRPVLWSGRVRPKGQSMALQDVFPAASQARRARDSRGLGLAWLALLLVAAIGSSFTFACVTPFCAFAVLTAGTMSRGGALATTLMVWAINQTLGYGVSHYPLDLSSVAWGGAIALGALAATLAARASFGALRGYSLWHSIPVAFVAALIAYEGLLFVVSLVLGGSANFAIDIDAKVALSDAGWLVGIGILRYWLVGFAPVLAGRRYPVHS
jgi:hypothetical protein